MPHLKINNRNLLLVSVLVILASALGLFVPDFYAARDNAMTTYEIAGQDAISLAFGILLFLLTLMPKKGTLFAVIAAGFLVYTTYIYAYFLFGLLVTRIFAVYLVITSLSFYTLIAVLTSLACSADVPATTRQKWVSGYLIFIVVLVGFIDGTDIIANTVFSKGAMTPQDAFYYLDLAFLFPAMVIAAVMNFKRQSHRAFLFGCAPDQDDCADASVDLIGCSSLH